MFFNFEKGGSSGASWLTEYTGAADKAAVQLIASTVFAGATGSVKKRMRVISLGSNAFVAAYQISTTTLNAVAFTLDSDGDVASIGAEFSLFVAGTAIGEFAVAPVPTASKFGVICAKTGAGGTPSGASLWISTFTVSSNTISRDADLDTGESSGSAGLAISFTSTTNGAWFRRSGTGISSRGLTIGSGSVANRGAASTSTFANSAAARFTSDVVLIPSTTTHLLSSTAWRSGAFINNEVIVSITDSGSALTTGAETYINQMDGTADPLASGTGGALDSACGIRKISLNANGSAGIVSVGAMADNCSGYGYGMPQTMIFFNSSLTITPNQVLLGAYRGPRAIGALRNMISHCLVESGVTVNGVSYDIFLGVFLTVKVTTDAFMDYTVRPFAIKSSPSNLADAMENVLLGVYDSGFVRAADDYALQEGSGQNWLDHISGVDVCSDGSTRFVMVYEGAGNDPYIKVINKS